MPSLPEPVADAFADAMANLALFGHTRPKLFIATTVLTILLPFQLVAAVRSYCGYLAIGPGGIPHNLFGWCIQGIIQPFGLRNTRSPDALANPSPAVVARYGGSERATRSYRSEGTIRTDSSARRGPRPTIPGYVAPQRQITDVPAAAAATRATQEAFLQALAAANPDVLTIRPSQLEGNHTPALWAKQGDALGTTLLETLRRLWSRSPNQASQGPVEICHAHAEASSHMQLSLADAEWVLRMGWGERHLLSGSPVMGLPPSYVIVYAPRDEDEMRVWKELAMAAARFSVGSAVDLKGVEA